jgi:hypothetical protein
MYFGAIPAALATAQMKSPSTMVQANSHRFAKVRVNLMSANDSYVVTTLQRYTTQIMTTKWQNPCGENLSQRRD